jgi:hypothetical protein
MSLKPVHVACILFVKQPCTIIAKKKPAVKPA